MTHWRAMHYDRSDVCALSKRFWTLEVSVERRKFTKGHFIFTRLISRILQQTDASHAVSAFPKAHPQRHSVGLQQASSETGSGEETKTEDPDQQQCQFL